MGGTYTQFVHHLIVIETYRFCLFMVVLDVICMTVCISAEAQALGSLQQTCLDQYRGLAYFF